MPQHEVASEAAASRADAPQAVRLVRDTVHRATVVTAGLTARDLLAVSVSGGPDSVVLLDALLAPGSAAGRRCTPCTLTMPGTQAAPSWRTPWWPPAAHEACRSRASAWLSPPRFGESPWKWRPAA